MVKKLAKKHWLNIITLLLIGVVILLGWEDLVKAWHLMWQIDIWIFLLVVPLQFLSYYAGGAMIFSYLKSRGDLKNISALEQPRMALELNFVNHIFPSAGVSGASYMTYRLGKYGVNHGRAALAQVVRLVMQFTSYAALMIIAVIWVTFDGDLTRFTILIASSLLTVILAGLVGIIYLLGSLRRLKKFENFIDNFLNKKVAGFLRREKPLVDRDKMHGFFKDLHKDFIDIKSDPKCLKRPFWWGIVFNLAETSMFFVAFLSLGSFINPASVLIALGLAGLAGAFLITPGGAGGYEAAMIFFLSIAGVTTSVAVAGVLLTRSSLMLLTIVSGYFFYSAAMRKNGKHRP